MEQNALPTEVKVLLKRLVKEKAEVVRENISLKQKLSFVCKQLTL